MISSLVILIILIGSAGLVLALAVVAALSRHEKAATGELDLIGAVAFVETSLEPEGSVIVRGELWRALSPSGAAVKSGGNVRVVGARGHLLEVEPVGGS